MKYMDFDDKQVVYNAKKDIRQTINYEFRQQDVDHWHYDDGSGDFLSEDSFFYTKDAELIVEHEDKIFRYSGLKNIAELYRTFQKEYDSMSHQLLYCEAFHLDGEDYMRCVSHVQIIRFVNQNGSIYSIISRLKFKDEWVQRAPYSEVLHISSRKIKVLWSYKVPVVPVNEKFIV